MVSDYQPFSIDFFPDQGEMPTGIADFSGQVKLAEHKGRFGAQFFNFEDGEIQFSHGGLVGIGLFVALQGGLPAFVDAIGTDKNQVRAVPVAGHEAVDVALVPAVLLALEF